MPNESASPLSRSSTRIVLASRPHGEPRESDFAVDSVALPDILDGQVVLRVVYLSLDPYMRGRMSKAKSYAAPIEIGDVIVGETVCEVVESRAATLDVGDMVLASTGWQTHAVASADDAVKIGPSPAPSSTRLGVLGMPGFTACAGLLEIGRPAPGETVVVAAATGPVGAAVGQIAKLRGATAIGIAGGPDKCRALIDAFGFDAAVDHGALGFERALKDAAPNGVDVYFENVGGHVADAVWPLLNKHARVPICGLVAGYDATAAAQGPDRLDRRMATILIRSLTVRGFIQDEFVAARHADFIRDMSLWVEDGSVRYREDIVHGLDNAPAAFGDLLAGRRFGKVLVQVGPVAAAPATTRSASPHAPAPPDLTASRPSTADTETP